MRTNLSRFTVAFSDLDWHSVFPAEERNTGKIPAFPKAYEVGRYLEVYSSKFGLDTVIQLNTKVIKARLDQHLKLWEITTQDPISGRLCKAEFDYLVIASGFFDKPGRSFDPSPSKSLPNVQHTSRFRDLSSLTPRAGKIVVIGGGISGTEAAASAAFQISNARTQAGAPSAVHADSRIYHIVNRPLYVLPRHLPARRTESCFGKSDLAPKLLPLDLILYDLTRRGGGAISAATSIVPPEKARKGHEFLRSVLGGDQSDLGSPELVYSDAQLQYPAYTSITDTYAEFVRSGVIIPVQGWVDEVKRQQNSDSFDIYLKQFEPWYHAQAKKIRGTRTIENVTGIIEATGFKVDLDYLDATVKAHLDFDPSCARIPFRFTQASTVGLPNLAAVGFYEGPFWGVMEMQARYIADIWARGATLLDNLDKSPKSGSFSGDVVGEMREAMKDECALQVPQFWMSDYVGFVEQFAREVGIARNDQGFGHQLGPAFPARYCSSKTADLDGDAVVQEVLALSHEDKDDVKYVAPAVFRGLQGLWNFSRKIEPYIASSPRCTYTGTAHFHPRSPADPSADAEYLYEEDSTFESDQGHSFGVTRSYVYTYYDKWERIIQNFVVKDGETFNTPSHTWKFHAPGSSDGEHGWMASHSHHECEPQTYYTVHNEFRFMGANIKSFCLKYEVKGPSQHYIHETWYERPKAGVWSRSKA
ncbi:hypothetical protein NX059_007582 [Plenodomus lindquistii]|nr:hypothetical protein NX059_007582 [Plenodomus lindquistii]